MRKHQSLVPLLVVALATGCIAPPSRDANWRGSGNTSYAASRRRMAGATGAVGMGLMGVGIGLGAAGLGNVAAIDAHDALTEDEKDARRTWSTVAAIGGAIALVGLLWGPQQLYVRGQWTDQIGGRLRDWGALPGRDPDRVVTRETSGNGAGPAAAERVRLGVETSPPMRGRLFLRQRAPLPPGAEAFEVVRVHGPADPVAADLAARVPVLCWPVVVLGPRHGRPAQVLVGVDALTALAGE